MVAGYEAGFHDPAGWWGCEVAGRITLHRSRSRLAAGDDEDMGGFLVKEVKERGMLNNKTVF